MNLQEQIEKAFKAGYRCAETSVGIYPETEEIDFMNSDELDKAVVEYLNKVELFTEIK